MTPTHTSREEVPSRIPHTSYDAKFYIRRVAALITRTFWCLKTCWKTVYGWIFLRGSIYKADSRLINHTYLGLNSYFDEAADDGEDVADNEQNIPAVNELHSVSPAHTTIKSVFEKLSIFLCEEIRDLDWTLSHLVCRTDYQIQRSFHVWDKLLWKRKQI